MNKIVLAPLILLLIYFTGKTVPLGDFAGYYFGSWELWKGNHHAAYDTAALNLLINQPGVFVSYTPFPPFTAVAMAPFLLLPVHTAKTVFVLFSAVLFVITVYRAKAPAWMVLAIPIIFFTPLRNNIVFGQSYLLLTVLLLEGYTAYKKGRLVLAAVLWSFAMVFKIFPVCILFYLLSERNYRQFWYCIIGCLFWGGLSLLCIGWDAWRLYVFELLPRLNNGELNDSYTYAFQSAFMLLKNLFVFDAVQNPDVAFNSSAVFIIANALYKAFIIAACIRRRSFGLWILGSLLISPNGSSYSLILLLVPFLETRSRWWLLLIICNLPIQWFGDLPTLLQYPRLYLLLAWFVLLVKPVLFYKPALALAALFFLTDLPKFFRPPDRSDYLLSVNTPLIYDFTVKNKRLVYYYFDVGGRHEQLTDVVVEGYRLFKNDTMVINNSQVVYLSDKGRGVGFYTLRVERLRSPPGQ